VRSGPTSSPDVIVIGGGIIGVSAAAHLAERGRRVTLVERSVIGAGASGRNSGVVQHPLDPVLVALHLETLDLYESLGKASGDAFRLPASPAGLLQVTVDTGLAERLAAELHRSHPGLRPTYLPPDEVRRLEPGLADGVAACRLDIGYPVGPARATAAYEGWARSLGVDIRLGSGAQPSAADGSCRGVRLDDGTTLGAGAVIVAAGPWSPALVDPTGRWRPIRPLWGVVVTVDLAEPPQHVLEEAEIEIEPAALSAKERAAGAGHDPGGDESSTMSFSLITAEGASSLGSTFLGAEPDAAALVDGIVQHGARYVPAIATARRGAHRVCARPQSLDGRPLVGPVPGVDGLWIAAGHGPWGISTGPASGRHVAELITDPLARIQPALDPARFGPIRG
jgi:D-hydroxyproline dehydrogenase subunit beta